MRGQDEEEGSERADAAGQRAQRVGEKASEAHELQMASLWARPLKRKGVKTQGAGSVKFWEGERLRARQLV